MDPELKDQVAVVVGAASGIGLATASQFVSKGAQVCWLDISESVYDVAQRNSNSSSAAFARVVDATDFESLCTIAEEVDREFGRCDHLVISIGQCSGKFGFPFWNVHPTDWAQTLNVNLIGPVNATHAFVTYMLTKPAGTICFVSSVAGQIGSQTDPPYSAAKAGLINFGQCVAKDLAAYNIRANVVCPGMVKTPMNRQVWQAWVEADKDHKLSYDDWAELKIQQNVPLNRWQSTNDVASLITFLASDHAQNITGQTMNVDGGQVMHW